MLGDTLGDGDDEGDLGGDGLLDGSGGKGRTIDQSIDVRLIAHWKRKKT